MALQLIIEQLEEFKEIYNYLDDDKDGLLSITEFRNLMSTIGQGLSQNELRNLAAAAKIKTQSTLKTDEAHEKELPMSLVFISFVEFMTIMSGKVQQDDDLDNLLIEAFKVFDANCDGVISSAELLDKMQAHGEPLTIDEVTDMVKEADTDGDGLINYDEFVTMMCGRAKP